MSLLSLSSASQFGQKPLFALLTLGIAIGITIFLLFVLLRSYPLAFLGLILVVGLGFICIFNKNQYLMLGILWVVFSAVTIVASALNLYKNVRGAAWWAVAAIIGVILSPFFCADCVVVVGEKVVDGVVEPIRELNGVVTDNSEITMTILKSAIVPVAVFLVVGLVFSILVPRLMFIKRRNERKHLTNIDPLIKQKVEIIKDATDDNPARGMIGDVDWSIKPFFPHDKFKTGDIVKVVKIEGVTLLCVRDGRDLRAEMRAEHAAEAQERKAEAEAKHAEKMAKKAAKKEAAMKETQTVSTKEKVTSSKRAGLYGIITAIVLVVLFAVVVIASLKIDGFYPIGAIVFGAIIFIYILVLIAFRLGTDRKIIIEKVIEKETPVQVVKEVKVVEQPKVVVQPVVAPVAAPVAPKKVKAEFVPFAVRMKKASKDVKDAYNEIKSEILSYGIKSRVSNTGDTFRLHTKEYVKIVVAGKTLKLYMALNPKDYKNSPIPHDDASKMTAHKETPFVFRITSSLSVRRAKTLIAECAKKDGLVQGEVVVANHVKELQ